MPRPPKNKAIEPAKIAVAPPRHIDVDNFIRVRDSVSHSLVLSSSALFACIASHRQRVSLRYRARIITMYHHCSLASGLCIRLVVLKKEPRVPRCVSLTFLSRSRVSLMVEKRLWHQRLLGRAVETVAPARAALRVIAWLSVSRCSLRSRALI